MSPYDSVFPTRGCFVSCCARKGLRRLKTKLERPRIELEYTSLVINKLPKSRELGPRPPRSAWPSSSSARPTLRGLGRARFGLLLNFSFYLCLLCSFVDFTCFLLLGEFDLS